MARRDKRHPKVRPPDPNSMQANWRLFIAVPMPDPVRALVGKLIAAMSADDLPIRWVDPETAHLTLHFLGDTSPDRAELLRLALASPVGRHASLRLVTSDLGVFPNPRQPRVVWLGLNGDVQRLERLAREIGLMLRGLDFSVEAGRFRPHVTLGRVRENPPPDLSAAVERALQRARENLSPLAVPVAEVLLVRSFLGKGGARHEPIAHFRLAENRAR